MSSTSDLALDDPSITATTSGRPLATKDLLALTAVCSLLFAGCRYVGPSRSFSMFLILYAFGPVLVVLVASALRHVVARARYTVCGLSLIVITTVTLLLAYRTWGSDAVPMLLMGAIIEWPGQAAVLVCLKLLLRRSTSDANVALYADGDQLVPFD